MNKTFPPVMYALLFIRVLPRSWEDSIYNGILWLFGLQKKYIL